MKFKVTKECTTIYDCYLIDNYSIEIIDALLERKKKGLSCNRTVKSYLCELKAHARLYKLGLFRSHTKDADLEENISKTKDFIYRILGI